MERKFFAQYWKYMAQQDEANLRRCFTPDSVIQWYCTNELFTLEEFIQANCQYPCSWQGELERFEQLGNAMVTAARI